MSLNDDSGDDVTFDDLFGDPTKLNENQPIPPILAVVNSEQRVDNIKEESIFGEGIVKNELPNVAAIFIDDQQKTCSIANELLDIQSSLRKSNGICKEDAVVIDSLCTGFINEKKPLGFFTEDKTKTQLSATMQTLDKEIDLQVAKAIENLNSFIDKVNELTLPRIKELEGETKERITLLQNEVLDVLRLVSYPSSQTKLPDGFSVNSFLDIRIEDSGYESEESLNKGIEMLPDDIRIPIYNLRKGLRWPNKFMARLAHLYAKEVYKLDEHIFCFGDVFSTIGIANQEIFELPPEHKFSKETVRLRNETIYYHSTLLTGKTVSDGISNLITWASSCTTGISKTKDFVKEISLSTATVSEKLKTLDHLSKDMVRDSLLITSILTFMEELLEFLFRLKTIYKTIHIS